VLPCAAKTGEGLDAWFDAIEHDKARLAPTMELDYDLYAEGEALLGWLNCTVRLSAPAPFDANDALLRLARELRGRIAAKNGEIAHLKMTLDSEDGTGSLSVVSIVRNDGEPDLRESLMDRVTGGSLILNLRAEADPEFLKEATEQALAALGSEFKATIEHLERFRPARPRPIHRMSGPEGGLRI
jgi:hypothetical protein